MANWEYRVDAVAIHEEGPKVLNELGAEGWELVHVGDFGFCYFKRPVAASVAED